MSHGQIVCLTRCEDTPGFPELLRYAIGTSCFRWMPEYTVYEQYHDYHMTQYLARVVIPPDEEYEFHGGYQYFGLGITVEMAIQEAAYNAVTRFRWDMPPMANTSFMFCPSAPPPEQALNHAEYHDLAGEMNPTILRQAQFIRALDQEFRVVRHQLFATRERLWDLLLAVEPSVRMCRLSRGVLDARAEPIPDDITPPGVGGFIPPRGPSPPGTHVSGSTSMP